MVAWFCEDTKDHWIVHFQRLNFIVCNILYTSISCYFKNKLKKCTISKTWSIILKSDWTRIPSGAYESKWPSLTTSNSDSVGLERSWHLCLMISIGYSDAQSTVRTTSFLNKYPLSQLLLAETKLQLILQCVLEPRIQIICTVDWSTRALLLFRKLNLHSNYRNPSLMESHSTFQWEVGYDDLWARPNFFSNVSFGPLECLPGQV